MRVGRKVYCIECRYYEDKTNYDRILTIKEDRCKSLRNSYTLHTYREQVLCEKKPEELNKNNRCDFFESIPLATAKG